jgi:predicted nuclease of predicted toxin-antitoxin system
LSSNIFPSVVTFRTGEISVETFKMLMSMNLPGIEIAIQEGALITIDLKGTRFQRLPVRKSR